MYALFEFQGSETITPPDPPNPPGVPESSSAIAVILTGVSILLTKGKKNSPKMVGQGTRQNLFCFH